MRRIQNSNNIFNSCIYRIRLKTSGFPFSTKTTIQGENLSIISDVEGELNQSPSHSIDHSKSMNVNTNSHDAIVKSCKDYTLWSWSAQKSVDPITMIKASGVYFWDANHKRYFDLNSQLMCMNIGHQHPKVIAAIKSQCDELVYAGPNMATRVRAEFGPLLAPHTPNQQLTKFFFTLGGSEANENAIKLAKFYTNRTKIITRYKSYHGATVGSINLTGDSRRWPNEALGSGMSGVIRVFDPYKYRSLLYKEGMPDEEFSSLCLQQLEETILLENPEAIAAMFVETVTGTNGLIPPPEGYLKGLRNLLTKYDILMVCDEVMCGLGRTGKWFACEHWDVVPDILTMAKGITSSYMPLGVVAMKPEIAKAFDEKVFSGGLTYSGHPLSLAAACATIKVLEEEKIVENSASMGILLNDHLQRMKLKHKCVGDIRSIGLFGALELVLDRKTKQPFKPYTVAGSPMAHMMKYLKENGVFAFSTANLLHTNPPLIVTKEQLSEVFEIIDRALEICDQAC